MENDEFRMQNGGPKVAISGAPIDAQGCGLSPAESGSEHEIVSRGGHTAETILWHLLLSVANARADWLSRRHGGTEGGR